MAKRKTPKAARDETTALYVRLPTEEAEKLDRIAFELKTPKREVIRTLVADHLAHDVLYHRRLPEPPMVGRAEILPPPVDDVLTAEQAAELLQAEVSAVKELAESGELPARKVGGEWRFLRRAVLDWLGGGPAT